MRPKWCAGTAGGRTREGAPVLVAGRVDRVARAVPGAPRPAPGLGWQCQAARRGARGGAVVEASAGSTRTSVSSEGAGRPKEVAYVAERIRRTPAARGWRPPRARVSPIEDGAALLGQQHVRALAGVNGAVRARPVEEVERSAVVVGLRSSTSLSRALERVGPVCQWPEGTREAQKSAAPRRRFSSGTRAFGLVRDGPGALPRKL